MSVLFMTIRLAFRMLRRNPMRAALTMLGIIIGVGAVVAMVSLGQGAAASVQAQITTLGTNLLIVIPGATTVSGGNRPPSARNSSSAARSRVTSLSAYRTPRS